MNRIFLFTLAAAALVLFSGTMDTPRWAQASESAPVVSSESGVSSDSGEPVETPVDDTPRSPLPAVFVVFIALLVILKFAFGGNG